MQKTLKIYGREYKGKTGTKFTSYSYTKDGKTFYKVKFTKASNFNPSVLGYCKLVVDDEDCSIQKGKLLDNGTLDNKTIWVKKVISFEADEEANKEAEERKKAELADILSSDEI